MKMNKTSLIILTIVIVALLSGGFFLVAYEVYQNQQEAEQVAEEPKYDYDTFADYTTVKAFESVPVLFKEGCKIGDAYEYGKGHYTISINGTTKTDYEEYLASLKDKGFKKHSDNGSEGMEGYVYTAAYTKDELVVSVYHVVKYETTYITVSEEANLSDHLIYDEAYIKNATPEAKTKVHMLELCDLGNSFVIQLKNGHFIVEDGGQMVDAPYLLDYLESLTPEGEKPVIEAWFITHSHSDHVGALKAIVNNIEYYNRIYVDGVYYVDPSDTVQQSAFGSDGEKGNIYAALSAGGKLKREDGSATEFYRPVLGQRYYFCDIMIDIVLTLDQLPNEAYDTADYNDTSTWFMHHIEGQRFLHAGDAGVTTTRVAMDFYDKEYFDMDVFSVLHHGINVYNHFTDYCDIKTLLYTNRRVGSLYTATNLEKVAENAHLQESALESLSHGNGTVVLTFPYSVGTSEIMEPCDWKYHNGERPHKIWDVFQGREQ